MTRPVVFYAWQSDRPRKTTRDLIKACAVKASEAIATTVSVDDAPRIDHDVLNQSGTPPIAETIFRKIRTSAIFLADVTFTAESRSRNGQIEKQVCNPNVMVELGFAVATLGWDRVVLVMNKHYGSPDKLPFDLRNHRFPITYDLGPELQKDVFPQLSDDLATAFRLCLSAEYDLVASTLERLSAFSRALMKKYGQSRMFWETTDDNKILSRLDLAVTQMLEAGVVRCVDAATDIGVGYAWTYLGQQCCKRLGVEVVLEPFEFQDANLNVIVNHAFYEQLSLHGESETHMSDCRPSNVEVALNPENTEHENE